VESSLGRGTQFIMRFPSLLAENDAA
jgi:hypothetical protein